MRKFIKQMLTIGLGVFLGYIMLVFITGESDPTQWHWVGRLLAVMWTFIIASNTLED